MPLLPRPKGDPSDGATRAVSASIRIEVICDEDVSEFGVGQPDPVSGAWDFGTVVRFERVQAMRMDPDSAAKPSTLDAEFANKDVWSGSIPVPAAGSQFKFALRGAVSHAWEWEPLGDARRWPTLSDGSVLRVKYGEPRMSVEVSNAAIEANARATRKLEARVGSALQENLDKKGDNAYYHAHNRPFEVPEHAKVITGPGLITGGAPVLLEAGAMAVGASEEDRCAWLKDFSWADYTDKVKVYVAVPEGLLPAEGADGIVEVDYKAFQVDVLIKARPRQRLKLEKLSSELKVESCTTRVEPAKNRIVLQLYKKKNTTWYNLTKK